MKYIETKIIKKLPKNGILWNLKEGAMTKHKFRLQKWKKLGIEIKGF